MIRLEKIKKGNYYFTTIQNIGVSSIKFNYDGINDFDFYEWYVDRSKIEGYFLLGLEYIGSGLFKELTSQVIIDGSSFLEYDVNLCFEDVDININKTNNEKIKFDNLVLSSLQHPLSIISLDRLEETDTILKLNKYYKDILIEKQNEAYQKVQYKYDEICNSYIERDIPKKYVK